jgi:ribosomal-protein-alanine N-acetyltransferase
MTVPAPAALVLEAATPDDITALVALEARCHTHPWSEAGLRDAMAPASGAGTVLLLRAPRPPDDAQRGIRAYCAFQVVLDEAHVHNLAVVPEWRRHGLARRLLALTLEIAARNGARSAHLEVRAGNAAARGLYRAMGFREVGTRRGYYSAPVEDAILLSRADLAGPVARNLERPAPKC